MSKQLNPELMQDSTQRATGLLEHLSKIWVQLISGLIIIVLFFGLSQSLMALKEKPEIKKRKSSIRAIMATPAVLDTVRLTVRVQGESRAQTEIDLVPEVAGKITYVSPKFLTGGKFTKGDVLYRIDDANYQVAIIRADAGVARAQQLLTREKAESEIARQDWEDLGQGLASGLTLRKPQLLEAQANLQSAQADLEIARLQLARTAVKAPFNGRVREKIAGLGQYVNPGSGLGRIFSSDVAEVRLALNDADLSRLDLPIAYVAKSWDDAPNVRLSAIIGGKERVWQGRIMRTAATYDTKTRSLFAMAEVRHPYDKGAAEGGYPLAPGLFVSADIVGKNLSDVIVIPRDGLRPESIVYVVTEEGIAESRTTQVLDVNPQRAVILSGIEAGEFIILSPLEKSQVNVKFKALDVNDPTIILVEPKEEDEEDGDKKDDDVKFSKKELRKKHKIEKQKKREDAKKAKLADKEKQKNAAGGSK
ncbi:MAG: efflux transporter periplasmic adaptor subunit [Robiginitomaculum sp.]|nr:MAG: efflux transporter periplasmic adaptor subunit [Robiginitomaculum sp.]